MAAGAEAAEAAVPPLVDQGLREDAARRVTGAEKQHVVGTVGQVFDHANRGTRTQGAKLLARLHLRGRTAALDRAIAVARKEIRSRLREKNELVDLGCTRRALELAHDTPPEAPPPPLRSDDHRAPERPSPAASP